MRGRPDFMRTAMLLAACAILPPGAAADEQPGVGSILKNHRCMVPIAAPARDGGGQPPVLSAPRAGATTLGPAEDPVIVMPPSAGVDGYLRVLLTDGRQGWVRRDRVRAWAVAASPGLRCIPAIMSNGRPGVTYAHPG